jgi:hypothetical protein
MLKTLSKVNARLKTGKPYKNQWKSMLKKHFLYTSEVEKSSRSVSVSQAQRGDESHLLACYSSTLCLKTPAKWRLWKGELLKNVASGQSSRRGADLYPV